MLAINFAPLPVFKPIHDDIIEVWIVPFIKNNTYYLDICMI